MTIRLAVLAVLSWLSLGAGEPEWDSRVELVTVTAYCPCRICCGPNAKGITKSGRSAHKAGVAGDDDVIPLGAYVDVPGYHRGPNRNGSWIIVDDLKAKHTRVVDGLPSVDLRFSKHAEAVAYGKRTEEIVVWTRRKN